MPKIRIDQKDFEVEDGKNLLEACLSLGFDLPYFCWHPALGSVGACRQCAVKHFKDESDTRGKIVMSCMTAAAEGTRISIEDPEAKVFRAAVIEWLMVNHPHDCPICDEGGECHLQDMTVMTGHTYRRYRFKKRTFRNQDLGPFVNHEMNRCIACYRCVRFYRDYAGGRDFNVFSTHDQVYFGRFEDGVLENEFSGNLVEVCPTGVFTDKTLKKHYARKWDLQTAPSVCGHCSLGCNTIPGERYGELRRIRNRYHSEINGYFICDRGRYGYEYVNSDRRIRDLWFRKERHSPSTRASDVEALEYLGRLFSDPIQLTRTIGIGSPRASLEVNHALRTLVGPSRFHDGLSDSDGRLIAAALKILRDGPVPSASLQEVENADAVLILGEDVTQTAPRLALSLRQSAQKGPLLIAAAHGTKLDEIATRICRSAPDDIARLGFAVAHALSDEFPEVPGLPRETAALADSIAQALGQAKKPVIVSGTGIRSEAVLKAAANVAWALFRRKVDARICLTGSESNSFGLGLMGGNPLSSAFIAMEAGQVDTVIVVENDLFRRADPDTVRSFFSKAKRVILLDHTATATTPRSDILLPSASFAESNGTFVNQEGRAQRFYQVFEPKTGCRDSWKWLRDIMIASGYLNPDQWRTFDEIASSLAESSPLFGHVTEASLPAGFRVFGAEGGEENKIPRQPHRYSGRTSMNADVSVHEPKPPQDPDSPLSFSMEGFEGKPPAPLITRYWAPGWNSVQALGKFQVEVGGPLRGGSSGKRLIEPALLEPETRDISFRDIPAAFSPRGKQRLAIPLHHIFGSEELSNVSPAVARLAPRPYVMLSRTDAQVFEISEGDTLDILIGGTRRMSLRVRLDDAVCAGTIGIPVGLSGLEGADIDLPAWCELVKQQLAGVA